MTIAVNRSNETWSLQKGEALESSRLSAASLRDSISAAEQNESLGASSPNGPSLEAPKKKTSADDAMLEFVQACTSSFNASASASAAQTINCTNLNQLNTSLEYSVLYSTQVEVAKEEAEQQIQDKLASDIDDAEKREGGVGSYLGWIGFGIVTAMVLAELIFTAGAAAPAAAEEEVGATSLVAGDEAAADSGESAGASSLGDAGGSVSDLEADQSAVNEDMQANESQSNSVKDSAKDVKNPPKAKEEEGWGKWLKNKVKSGCRTITQKIRPNPQSYFYRGFKFAMQATGSITSATPQIIKGVDQIVISEAQATLATCQEQLGELKGNLQSNIAVASSFQTLNKKMGDLLNELTGQVGSDLSICGSAFTTWGRVEIEG